MRTNEAQEEVFRHVPAVPHARSAAASTSCTATRLRRLRKSRCCTPRCCSGSGRTMCNALLAWPACPPLSRSSCARRSRRWRPSLRSRDIYFTVSSLASSLVSEVVRCLPCGVPPLWVVARVSGLKVTIKEKETSRRARAKTRFKPPGAGPRLDLSARRLVLPVYGRGGVSGAGPASRYLIYLYPVSGRG